MSKKYENCLKKNKRKVKRVPIPKTIGDYLDNILVDLKNYNRFADQLDKISIKDDTIFGKLDETIKKLKWYGFQINDSLSQITKICLQRGIYSKLRNLEQL